MATLLSYALTTLSDVKETLSITGTSSDNLLTRKINQATEIIIGYCNRRFDEQTNVVEYYDGRVEQQLLLRNRPITGTTTFVLEARDTTLNDNDFTTIDSNEYFVDTTAGLIDGVASFRGTYDRYRVTYSYGVTTIPADISEACVSIATYLYNNDAGIVANISSKSEGSRSIDYSVNRNGSNSNDIITQLGLKTMLDRYTEIVISGQR